MDARSLQEFGAESIPGSINIPYDSVMTNGRIKDEAKLKVLFSGIRKDKPVVVYTTTGVKASLVWFALEIMGYDARLSTWQERSIDNQIQSKRIRKWVEIPTGSLPHLKEQEV